MKPIDFASLRVLVLEDQPFIRTLLKQLLRSLGTRDVREGADGTEGLKLLDEGRMPDLVLCDFQMTPMDGLTFVRQVRESANPVRAKLPMIMLTAAADEEVVRTAAGLGVGGFLVKPVSQRMLAERMTAALAARGRAAG